MKEVTYEDWQKNPTPRIGDNKIRWWSSNRSEELNVYAWKEIDKLYRE